jgi:hypothetical protein
MAGLIRNIKNLTDALGGVLSVSASFESITTFAQMAERKYIVKAIGIEQYNDLVTNLNGYSGANAATKNDFKDLITKAAAFYTFYEWAPIGMGRQTENGLTEDQSDKQQPGRKWVYDERRNQANKLAAEILESALVLLYANKAIFTIWAASTSFTDSFSLSIATGQQLGKHLPESGSSFRLYLTLRPWMAQVEQSFITELCGPTLLPNIKAREIAGTSTAADLAILPYIQAVVARVGYQNAFSNLVVVQTDDNGLRVLSEFDGTNSRSVPTKEQINMIRVDVDQRADQATGRLKSFLQKYFANYADYTASTAYVVAPGAVGFLDAGSYNTFFPMR